LYPGKGKGSIRMGRLEAWLGLGERYGRLRSGRRGAGGGMGGGR